MKNILAPILLLLIIPISAISQIDSNESYHSPLGIPLVLSSNFGELRPNHFHMGLDFKTNLKTGYKLYSIADGSISRIKVSPYGYGRVVYIDHPNGITSVYAHCSEFKGAVDSIVRITQQKEQNFEVEIFPGKGVLKVKKGEVFALSGNSGSSTAPHLHFEIRDTKTEHALNPLVFGFDIADSKAPEIRGVKVYALTKDGYRYPNTSRSKVISKGKYGYYLGADQITIPSKFCSKSGGIGMAFNVIDRLDGANNQCGLYGSTLIVNGDTIFGQRTDRVPFESTRYVNSHKDYEAYATLRKKYHKSFRTKENDLPIYINNELGILHVKPGEELDVNYIAYDVKGNTSALKFKLIIEKGEINSADAIPVREDHLHPSKTYTYTSELKELEFGYATVYEPVSLEKDKLNYSIAKGATPVNRPYRIKIKHQEIEDGKHYIEVISAKGKKRALTVQYKDGWAYADSKYFGTYQLKRDTIGPKVVSLNITKSGTTTRKNLQWRISDNGSGIADYDLFIDDEWVLLVYDYKTGLVKYSRPSHVTGKKTVVVRVKDKCGNEREWKRTITFN